MSQLAAESCKILLNLDCALQRCSNMGQHVFGTDTVHEIGLGDEPVVDTGDDPLDEIGGDEGRGGCRGAEEKGSEFHRGFITQGLGAANSLPPPSS